jgi:hypothetical protein
VSTFTHSSTAFYFKTIGSTWLVKKSTNMQKLKSEEDAVYIVNMGKANLLRTWLKLRAEL